MTKKFAISLFIVAVAVAALGEFFAAQQKPLPLPPINHVAKPIATTTVATTQPAPAPQPTISPSKPEQCNISQGSISTSTWKTFADPQWSFTFQYPPTWRLESGQKAGGGASYVSVIDKDGVNYFTIRGLPIESDDLEGEINDCPMVVDGRNIHIQEVINRYSGSSYRDFGFGGPYIVFVKSSPTAMATTNAIINTLKLKP